MKPKNKRIGTKKRVPPLARGSDFRRELRYVVIKFKDANAYLTRDERVQLERMAAKCAMGRLDNGKRLLQCVVVESDWPEYEPTWAAIKARMTGPNGKAQPRPDGRTQNL